MKPNFTRKTILTSMGPTKRIARVPLRRTHRQCLRTFETMTVLHLCGLWEAVVKSMKQKSRDFYAREQLI